MNKTSRFLAIGTSLIIALSTLWSCDKDSEQDNPEGTGVFIIQNASETPLYYLKADDITDTVFIDSFAVDVIEIYKEEESQATPLEFYSGKEFILYKLHTDGVTLVETYKEHPVTNQGWLIDKKDLLEYGVTHYSLYIYDNMLD